MVLILDLICTVALIRVHPEEPSHLPMDMYTVVAIIMLT